MSQRKAKYSTGYRLNTTGRELDLFHQLAKARRTELSALIRKLLYREIESENLQKTG